MLKKAISLFSGAGGDTLGMENSGINVVGFIEHDKNAIITHKINFPDSKLIGENICDVTENDLKCFKDIDIIFGGFPCTPFSKAGKQNPKDKRNQLYLEFIRIVKIIKPKIVIAENVEGLKNVKLNGKSFLDIIVDDFRTKTGYYLDYKLYNTIDFGIPQKRKRFIFIGSKNKNSIKFPEDIISCGVKLNTNEKKKRESKRKKISQEEYLEFSLENALKIDQNIIKKIKIPKNKWIIDLKNKDLPFGKPATNLIKCSKFTKIIDKKGKEVIHGISFRKRDFPTYSCVIDKNDFARTITARYDTMPRLFVPIKNKVGNFLRAYTVDEAKQIQGFPKEYDFSGVKRKEAMKQIGNAVPPPMITKIVKTLFS